MKLIDLTHELEDGLLSYSVDETPSIFPLATIDSFGYEVNKLLITTHTSTHIDAPKHVLNYGEAIDTMPLENFFGTAFILDVSFIENTVISLEIFCKIYTCDADYIFFYTGSESKWNTQEYLYNYKYPSLDLCDYISKLPIKGVGFDTISIDSPHSVSLENHKALLKNNKIIIENLNTLSLLKNKLCTVFIFPLKIKNGDGSPARIIAQI